MKTKAGIENISSQVIEILSSSNYPKTIHTICSRLIKQGVIKSEERWHYAMMLSHWFRQQGNIVNIKKSDGKEDTRMYIIKDNARKYWPEFLEGEDQ